MIFSFSLDYNSCWKTRCFWCLINSGFLSAKQFETDLTDRKSSIKLMIQDELTKLADEADDDDDEEEDTDKVEATPPASKKVKA